MSVGALRDFTLAIQIPCGYQLYHIKNTTEARAAIVARAIMTQWIEDNNLGCVSAYFGEDAPSP